MQPRILATLIIVLFALTSSPQQVYSQTDEILPSQTRFEIIESIITLHEALKQDTGENVGGNPNGDVTIVEFFDYRCSYCKVALSKLSEVMAKDQSIRLVYKEYPILGTDSVFASRAALAAGMQGKYLVFHNALMNFSGRLDGKTVLQIALEIGLNVKRLKEDLQLPEITSLIVRNHKLANNLGIRGTPSFIIGETIHAGIMSVAEMETAIEKARTRCEIC